MKLAYITVIFLSLSAAGHFGLAQSILDAAPSGRPNERAVLGGSHPAVIETNVPLPALIERFNGNWELVETFKGYWIGYTDDMYSIASHREDAIRPLVEFIRNASSDQARKGALLTLHLIGIESRIAGRFHEEFKSKAVREALYEFLDDPRLTEQVLLLLVRDPWPSDVPHVMNLLAREADTNCTQTVNALFRYALPCPAFGGTLQTNASSARVFVVAGKRTTEIGRMLGFIEEKPNEGCDRINQLISGDTNVVIQHRPNATRKVWEFEDPEAARRNFAPYFQGRDICEVTYEALLKDGDLVFRYCYLSDAFNFQVTGSDVYIIDSSAAKTRWLNWWRKQSEDYKNTLKTTERSVAPNGDLGPR